LPDKEFNLSAMRKPRIFYGYIIVGLCFLIMLVAFGLMDSFGVFVKPLLNEFGWTRATTSAAYSLSFLLFGFVGIVLGALTDRFGPRLILTLCGLCLGLGYLLMSQVNSLWQLFLFEGVIIGIGMSALYAPVLSLIARWFVKRRGLMTGIVLSGLGLGQLVSPPVISRLIEAYDWRLTYVFLGMAVLLVVVISTQFLKRDPSVMGLAPYGEADNPGQALPPGITGSYSLREAAATMQFWVLVCLKFCYGYYMFSMVIHIVPHATDLGISSVNAANILSISGVALVLGSFALGRAGDKIGPRRVIMICFVVALASLLWLMFSRELWMLLLFAVIIGIANGGLVASDSPMVARLFGLKSIGSIIGISSCAFSLGAALGPIMTGYIFDSTGSYQVAFVVCAAISAAGFIMALIMKPTKRLQGKV
jgi:MFS family permease